MTKENLEKEGIIRMIPTKTEQLKGADLQVAYWMAKSFLRSKSYPETNNYWKAVEKYCIKNLTEEELKQWNF